MSKCDFVISDAERNYFSFLDEWDMLYYYVTNVNLRWGFYDVESGTECCQQHIWPSVNVRYSLLTKKQKTGDELSREIGPYDEYLFPL